MTAALPPPASPPAGWYTDPAGVAGQRYFDGRHWTEHTLPAPAHAAEPHRRLPIVVAVGAIAALLISLIASRMLLEQIVSFRWPIVVYVVITVVVGYGPSLVWCWYAVRRWGSGHVRDDVGWHFRRVDLGWGPLTWLAAMVAEGVVASAIVALHIPFTSNTDELRDVRLDRTYLVSILIVAVVAAPVIEETIFRGLILPGFLSRTSPGVAVTAQGLVFGAVHIDPARGAGNVGLVLILGTVGIVFGGAAYLLRRIPPTMIAHAILNAVALTVVLLR